jgi:lipoate-protein ligase A
MRIDREALEAMVNVASNEPAVRFFGWDAPTVTYGYLLDSAAVKTWAAEYGSVPLVQRPTGGGAVYHTPADFSLSLLWPRASKIFSDHPRTCYAEIHSIISKTLSSFFPSPVQGEGWERPGNALQLHTVSSPARQWRATSLQGEVGSCATPQTRRFSACFQDPVCNDVMLGDKKIAGGALRVTKRALLYQGTIQLPAQTPAAELKRALARAFNR